MFLTQASTGTHTLPIAVPCKTRALHTVYRKIQKSCFGILECHGLNFSLLRVGLTVTEIRECSMLSEQSHPCMSCVPLPVSPQFLYLHAQMLCR